MFKTLFKCLAHGSGLRRTVLGAVVSLPAMLFATSADAVPTDVELQLLVDVSGSVSTSEFLLQRQGYSDAFRSQVIKDAITGGTIGSIAVQLIYWSSAGSQAIGVDWFLIDSDASSDAFANAVDAAGRTSSGLTAPGSAINFGLPLFTGNGFEGTSLVMDVSGDGSQNDGANTANARDAALAGGIDRINGIVIGGSASVLSFYQNNIQGGTNSFTLTAASFADFGRVVRQKLEAEITGRPIPVPATLILLGFGLAGLGLARRRRFAV